jgi:ribosomal protein S24E
MAIFVKVCRGRYTASTKVGGEIQKKGRNQLLARGHFIFSIAHFGRGTLSQLSSSQAIFIQ